MRNQICYDDLTEGLMLTSMSGHGWMVLRLESLRDIRHVTIQHCETGREDTIAEYKFNRLGMQRHTKLFWPMDKE